MTVKCKYILLYVSILQYFNFLTALIKNDLKCVTLNIYFLNIQKRTFFDVFPQNILNKKLLLVFSKYFKCTIDVLKYVSFLQGIHYRKKMCLFLQMLEQFLLVFPEFNILGKKKI